MRAVVLRLLPVVLPLVACAPTLDWREVRPDASGVSLLLPCKPERFERPVTVAGAATTMRMWSCRADGRTFSIAWLDAASAGDVAPALRELRAAGAANLGAGPAPAVRPRRVAGETPNADSGLFHVDGRDARGGAVGATTLLFAHGLRVYQASVLGAALAADDEATFLDSLRVAP